MYKKQFKIIQKNLGINKIISIRFSNTITTDFIKYQDTACTALARSLNKDVLTYIDRKKGQLCSGGNYFLGITHPPKQEIYEVYVKQEKVFKNNMFCNNFINKIPKYPNLAKKRYILLTPLIKETKEPKVIMLLVNPAQTSRILGLSAYQSPTPLLIIPALSTCASIYAPLADQKIHLNFIDYYDRYYQGKQKGRLFWKESNLIISLPFNIFKKIISNLPHSAHGNFKPKLKPQKVDYL